MGRSALGTVKTLNLATAIVGQTRKDLNGNRTLGYVQFSQHGRSYWISVQKTRYRDLAALKGTNPQVEAAVAAGLSLIGKAKYVYGGGRNLTDIQHRHYDCSSFVRHCYAQAGVDIGPLSGTTTYTLLNQGTAVPFKAMRRGDYYFSVLSTRMITWGCTLATTCLSRRFQVPIRTVLAFRHLISQIGAGM